MKEAYQVSGPTRSKDRGFVRNSERGSTHGIDACDVDIIDIPEDSGKDLPSGETGAMSFQFHYGYFVVLPMGLPIPSGDDWGRTPDSYKVGQSLGIKNGKQGTVVGIITGEPAKRIGLDVIVLVEQSPVGGPPSGSLSHVAINEATAYFVRGPSSSQAPPTIQTEWKAKNLRMVAIWNRLYPRPLTEIFQEFLIEIPLKGIPLASRTSLATFEAQG